MSSSVPVNCTKKSKGDDGTITSNCSLFVWGEIIPTNSDASCSAERYTGSVCRQQLLAWQECAIGGAEDVFLDRMITELSQPQREKQAYQFLQLLRKFYTPMLLLLACWITKLNQLTCQ